MALTIAKVRSGVQGDLAYWIGTITFDSSYASGGESFTPANVGLAAIDMLTLTPDQDTTSYLPVWDKSENKIMLYNSAGDGDAFDQAGTDDASSFVVYVKAEGLVGNRAITAAT